jgi:hypothetical protein
MATSIARRIYSMKLERYPYGRRRAFAPKFPRPVDAGLDPRLHHFALEFGEDAKHLKHRPTARRGRVDSLLFEVQTAADRIELAQKAERSSRSIDPTDNIDLSGGRRL